MRNLWNGVLAALMLSLVLGVPSLRADDFSIEELEEAHFQSMALAEASPNHWTVGANLALVAGMAGLTYQQKRVLQSALDLAQENYRLLKLEEYRDLLILEENAHKILAGGSAGQGYVDSSDLPKTIEERRELVRELTDLDPEFASKDSPTLERVNTTIEDRRKSFNAKVSNFRPLQKVEKFNTVLERTRFVRSERHAISNYLEGSQDRAKYIKKMGTCWGCFVHGDSSLANVGDASTS